MSQTGSYISSLVWETTDGEGPTRSEYQINWNAMDGHLHDNRGAGRGVRGIQTTAAPTQTGDIQINGDTLQWWGASSASVISAVNPAVAVSSLMFSGPAGVATTRFCGILAISGSPTTGTWKQWDFGYDEGGGIFLCTVAGSPGTWIQVGGPMTGDLKTTLRNTSDAGWALAYGQTVDGTTATYSNLWTYVNANALVGAGKPFTGTQAALVLPDLRGQALAGLDNMGGSAANVLAALTALGTKTGAGVHTLTTAELPHLSLSATSTVTDPGHAHNVPRDQAGSSGGAGGLVLRAQNTEPATSGQNTDSAATGITVSTSVSDSNGGGSHSIVQPTYGVNIQMKL